MQADGSRFTLQEQAVPGDGSCYVTVEMLDGLAELDANRQKNRTAPPNPGVTAILPLLRAPTTITLFENLVPLPRA